MCNKRKIKAVAGDSINYLCGYFCCTDILLMSLCRTAVLNNHLQCVVWVSLRCLSLDCSSWVFHRIRQKLRNRAVRYRYKHQTDSRIRNRDVSCPSSTLLLLIDKESNIGSARSLRPELEFQRITCFMLHCTLLIWPLYKYVNISAALELGSSNWEHDRNVRVLDAFLKDQNKEHCIQNRSVLLCLADSSWMVFELYCLLSD